MMLMTLLREVWFRNVLSGLSETTAHLPLVVRTDEITHGLADIPHRHVDFFALYIVRRGRGTHVIGGIPYGISRGDVYVMGPGVTHMYSRYEDLALDALYFTPDIFDTSTLTALRATEGFLPFFMEEPLGRSQERGGGGRWLHLTPDAYDQTFLALTELRSEWTSGTPGGSLLARGLFFRMLIHLARRYASSVSSGTLGRSAVPIQEATVAAAVRLMDERFAEGLRVEQVAASVFLSPSRFTEVFTAAMGRTPRDYLRYLRLERAKALLETTEDSVAEVGWKAGFSEPAYFARAFRAGTGFSPREWRRKA